MRLGPDPAGVAAGKGWDPVELMADARGYSGQHIYKGVPKNDLGEAARLDWERTKEGREWGDVEGTGIDIHERETDTGEKRYFLRDPETDQIVSATDLYGYRS
tara:strand:- start:346 stop:654 length:309 start_codon:yes stop_codon:yes gene_type:complete